MEKSEKRQYYITLIGSLLILIGLSVVTFTSFFSLCKENIRTIGESALAQETEMLNSYLSKSMDVVKVTAIMANYMLENVASADDVEKFLLS